MTPFAHRHAFVTPSRWTLACLGLALLAGCGSTPLPPWPTSPPAGAAPTVSGPAPAPTPAPPPKAVSAPTLTPIAQATVVGTPASREAPPAGTETPESAAVAARFAPPAVRYSTPGLAPERRAYTTNSELARWLQELAATPKGATRAQLLTLGPSQRGTPIAGLVLTRAQSADPTALEASGRPTVLLVGQQHGDEAAPAEALLVLARELSQGLLEPMLERINVIVVPRANPDGAEREEHLGANGVDIDRDHLRLSTPEAQALARLVRSYRPIALIDAHEYPIGTAFLRQFNALQRHDALLQHATTANLAEFITKAALEWYHGPMARALAGAGLSTEWYYRPVEGSPRLAMDGVTPDSLRNASGLKNMVALKVATRGSDLGRAHLQRRVHAQVVALTSALRSSVDQADKLEQVRRFVARDNAAQACRGTVTLEAAPTPTQRELVMLDPQTGAELTQRVAWESALQLRTLRQRPRACGYWLSASADDAAQRLRLLGLQVLKVAEAGTVLADASPQSGSGPAQRSTIDAPVGSYYLPLGQSQAALAIAALEEDAPGSYLMQGLIATPGDVARVMAPPSVVFEESE